MSSEEIAKAYAELVRLRENMDAHTAEYEAFHEKVQKMERAYYPDLFETPTPRALDEQ